ncbi:hypothetical protein LTR10_022903 [Elasticomyces elasticus]|uniref:Chalcone synthase n=1 Tax=Exophiala sideris TaxID=1016849 RepID=A0ABR0JKR7_9EURO|nr:hypothetical protein LTR10_022903 [Elasticomyces elasticus]KAK5032187.1 hypothetical protein LTR13_007404 [Exophiala sideris]KAK5036185.1 hypothetical protein LTS07_001910 [Exophiala sideris]KAK5066568.1 hypothetical protein LTR69_001914 [Exophiala sideris]KAK5180390.1 hypothetical protein LTR44_007147 [Eurotiomycetes sp. CCFEE 6388]
MSPAAVHNKVTPHYQRPELYIYGTGVEYPPYEIKPENLETLARRFYPKTPALDKVLTINEYTGIDSRSAIGSIDHPIANAPEAPTIKELCDVFLDHGVKLSVAACRKALEQWGGDLSEITHVVATTCTNSANPGYDHYVVKQLGLNQSIEKVLLHGIGCSGGLNALRTAANIALGSSFRRKPARVLVLACEISSTFVRSELDSIHENQEIRIGVTLFSDCASAVVLGNGFSDRYDEEPLLELLGWDHRIIEDTEKDLGFDVDPLGWKVVLTHRVPKLAAAAVPAMYEDLVASIPELVDQGKFKASEYDWALHPGGATVLSGVERAMKLKPELLRASYETYITHGNSSSATFFSVLNRLLQGETTEHIIGCAFGPGIAVEMMVFKRSNQGSETGTVSPTETLVAEDVD